MYRDMFGVAKWGAWEAVVDLHEVVLQQSRGETGDLRGSCASGGSSGDGNPNHAVFLRLWGGWVCRMCGYLSTFVRNYGDGFVFVRGGPNITPMLTPF